MKALGTTVFLGLLATIPIARADDTVLGTPHHETAGDESAVPHFRGMGVAQYPVSTSVPMAQRYFNQGMNMAYAFNFGEAKRSFAYAATLDPNCAMCHWGVAWVLGPNINQGMPAGNAAEAWSAVQKAKAAWSHANARERAFIWAMEKRYSPSATTDRKSLDRNYAMAMGMVFQRLPNDADAGTLYAESLMLLSPWSYWTSDGRPLENTPKIQNALERSLAASPNHVGANHFYIHAMEASPTPEKALRSADLLTSLVPAAGHLVHMPGHIYIRTGRYHQAVLANARAIIADRNYLRSVGRNDNDYSLMYLTHNYHFLSLAAAMEGNRDLALKAAHETARRGAAHANTMHDDAVMQHFTIMPLFMMVRFGMWNEILRAPTPPDNQLYARAIRHYARGMAFLASSRLQDAARERDAMAAIIKDNSLQDLRISGLNRVTQVMSIGWHVLSGELAARSGQTRTGVAHLTRAVQLEDTLTYMEPPDWFYPARENLAAVLLSAGAAKAAEKVYRENLQRFPNNGWGLSGLRESLLKQGRTQEARQLTAQLRQAWRFADTNLAGERFLGR